MPAPLNIYDFVLASRSIYENRNGLPNDAPQLVSEPKFFYASEKHATGLSHLQRGVAGKKGLIVLTGESGVGKTHLVNTLIQQVGTRVRVASFSHFDLLPTNFYKLLCEKFGIGMDSTTDGGVDDELLMRLRNFSEKCDKDSQDCMVIIDEAQNLSDDLFQQLTALSNLGTDKENLIQIVLVGGIELHDRLNLPELAALKRRIGVGYTLLPLDVAETEGYINTRLAATGMAKSPFTGDAIDTIYRYSRGGPRAINTLCDLALFIGSQEVAPEIGSPVVVRAAQMLYIQASAAPTVPQGAPALPALDEDHADTIGVRPRRLQARSAPELPVLADFPRLLEDEAGTGWRTLRRLSKIGLVVGGVAGLMFGMGVWQRHHTETIRHDPPSSVAPSVEGLVREQYQPVDMPVPLKTVVSTQNAATMPTVPVESPEPLHTRKVVIVQEGDTLWRIIQREYSDPHPRLLALVQSANPDITNPSRIRVGQPIVLPIHSQ